MSPRAISTGNSVSLGSSAARGVRNYDRHAIAISRCMPVNDVERPDLEANPGENLRSRGRMAESARNSSARGNGPTPGSPRSAVRSAGSERANLESALVFRFFADYCG